MSQMRGREVSDSLGAMSTFVRAAEARSFTGALLHGHAKDERSTQVNQPEHHKQ